MSQGDGPGGGCGGGRCRAAAVAARRGCSPLEVPLAEVKAALRAQGAIVPN